MARFSFSSRPSPLIVLLTDFGFRDSYVGVMKGVIRGICPSADVIDLSHNIMPHDVAEAAFVLSASHDYFPTETIFTCVVDPGVGTDRMVLCMASRGQTFLAPDNGLLSVIAERTGYDDLRKVTAAEFFLKGRGTTFHGRDIFAPVAAHLAAGASVADLGPPVQNIRMLRLPRPLRATDGSLRGQIIYIDQFGNLITNIRRMALERSFENAMESVEVHVKQRIIRGIAPGYAARPRGELVSVVGGTGYLEVAVNQGSAAEMLGCEKGDSVTLAALEPASGHLPEAN